MRMLICYYRFVFVCGYYFCVDGPINAILFFLYLFLCTYFIVCFLSNLFLCDLGTKLHVDMWDFPRKAAPIFIPVSLLDYVGNTCQKLISWHRSFIVRFRGKNLFYSANLIQYVLCNMTWWRDVEVCVCFQLRQQTQLLTSTVRGTCSGSFSSCSTQARKQHYI
jgi:hypothetical protein